MVFSCWAVGQCAVITKSLSGEVTIRQPGRYMQMVVYLTIASCVWVAGLIGIGALIWVAPAAGFACLTVLVPAVAWSCIRARRIDVRFDETGVTVRNFWRTHRLAGTT